MTRGAESSDLCPICSVPMTVWQQRMFDDRYGFHGWFDLLRCSSCTLIKTSPGLTEEQLPEVYASYYPRKEMEVTSLPDKAQDVRTIMGRLKIWLEGTGNQGQHYAGPGMKVLDYGCGDGTSLLELRAYGAEAYGVEADPNVKPAADFWHLRIYIGRLEDNPFPGTQFDLICLNQVIEHIPDPLRLLALLRTRLQERGIVVLSFPNVASIYQRIFGRCWINWHVPFHIFHYNLKSFERLCFQSGWKVIRCKSTTPNLWTLLQFKSLVIKGRMGVPNPLWASPIQSHGEEPYAGSQQSVSLIQRGVRRAWRLAMMSILYPIVAATNRLIDALGVGDSLLVFIQQHPATEGVEIN